MNTNVGKPFGKDYKANTSDFPITPTDIINDVKMNLKQLASNSNNKHPLLKKEVIDNLPFVFKEGVNKLVDDNDKLVYLVSAIGILSGIMPNVSGLYDGKRVAPNLFVFIIGEYGSGKGAMSYAKELIKKIESDIQEENERDLELWMQLPRDEKQEQPKPRPKGLLIPANASASAFLQMLNDNNGKGILFETEGDTLAQTLTTDHGNYSDILRKAFHHEFTAMARRTNNERIAMHYIQLSVLLTGTPNQFKRLIPDTENGLFSRFLYLIIEAEKGFRDVFNKAKLNYESEFQKLGLSVYNIHNTLRSYQGEQDITFEFTDTQKGKFHKFYKEEKPKFLSNTGDDAAGVFHRLALINFRIAMLFSILRHYEKNGKISDTIICEDRDYKTAKYITNELFKQCTEVYFSLPEQKDDKEPIANETPEVSKVKELKAEGLSLREIAKKVKISKSKVHRILKGIN